MRSERVGLWLSIWVLGLIQSQVGWGQGVSFEVIEEGRFVRSSPDFDLVDVPRFDSMLRSTDGMLRLDADVFRSSATDPFAIDVPSLDLIDPTQIGDPGVNLAPTEQFSVLDALIRIPKDFEYAFLAPASGLTAHELDASATVPIFWDRIGPPRYFISPRFQFRSYGGPPDFDLPNEVYTLALEFSTLFQLNDRWTLNAAFAPGLYTDFRQGRGDSFRATGRIVGFYRYSESTRFLLGVVATGRRDIPVVPALGLLYLPDPDRRVELVLPRPRLALRLRERPGREDWAFLAFELGGGSWAFKRANGASDLMTARDFRVLIGLETTPGQFNYDGIPPLGFQGRIEVGYAFGRSFEFEEIPFDFEPNGAFVLQLGLKF